jgi:hypothetical protein
VPVGSIWGADLGQGPGKPSKSGAMKPVTVAPLRTNRTQRGALNPPTVA